MSNVMQFESGFDRKFRDVIQDWRSIYLEAGMSEANVKLATDELERVLRDHVLISKSELFQLEVPAGLESEQIEAISESYQAAMNAAHKFHNLRMNKATQIIAELIGRYYLEIARS